MTSDVDLVELLDRVVLLEKEALAALTPTVTSDAVPYFLHTQEDFPYWTNRIGASTFEGNSEVFDGDTYTVIMRLVIGHHTEDYVGNVEGRLYTWIPQIKNFLNRRDGLQCATTYTDHMDGLQFARVTNTVGFREFQNAGISTMQLGTEFTLSCQFSDTVSWE